MNFFLFPSLHAESRQRERKITFFSLHKHEHTNVLNENRYVCMFGKENIQTKRIFTRKDGNFLEK